MLFNWLSNKAGRKRVRGETLASRRKRTRSVPVIVELLEARVLLSSQSQTFVNAAYLELLQRPAEPGGLTDWSSALDQNVLDHPQVVLGIEHSSEYHARLVE